MHANSDIVHETTEEIIALPSPPAEPPPPPQPATACRAKANKENIIECDSDDDSSIGSMEEALASKVDDQAAARWAATFSGLHTPPVDETSSTDTFFPQGSIIATARHPSPTNIMDFTRFSYKEYNTPLTMETLMNPTVNNMNVEQPLDLSVEGLDDMLQDYKADHLVSIDCQIRTIGIDHDSTQLSVLEIDPEVAKTLQLDLKNGELVDGGANVSLTADTSKLVGVRPIKPVKIGLAEANESISQKSCTEMGFLPITRDDGTLHYQPVLVSTSATDTILSPQSILHASKDLIKWTQTGFKDESHGLVQFFDKYNCPQITFKLVKRNGLYYTNHHSYGIDGNPVRTRCSIAAVQKHIARNEEITDDDSSIGPTLEAMGSLHITHQPSSVEFVPMSLPPLDESQPYEPLLDYWSEVPFDEDSPAIPPRSPAVNKADIGTPKKTPYRRRPVTPAKQLESELWAARLGFCGTWQLDVIPTRAEGLPNHFEYHPHRFIEHKEQARVRRQAANRRVEKVKHTGQRFYIDFGFMRASSSDFTQPQSKTDRVVHSYDGFNSYLAVIDEHSRMAWIYLTASKEPPIEEMSAHLDTFGLTNGGILRCDQGGELARSSEFRTTMLERHNYKVEPTGADSPSQNGGVEKWNDTFAVTVRALLYGSSLPAEFWSAALIHAVYLHNRRVHKATKRTPFEAWYGKMPNLRSLRVFGSRVCVKQTGKRRAKLDMHDFTGIFLGYSATDNNINYLDLNSGVVKNCHHATFDESWYSQPSRPPAAQLIYDLGLVEDSDFDDDDVHTLSLPPAKLPPLPPHEDKPYTPPGAKQLPLPLRLTDTPKSVAARAAKMESQPRLDPYANTVLAARTRDGNVVEEYDISKEDVRQVFCSPHPYNDAFEEELNLKRFNADKHPTAGFKFQMINDRLIVVHIAASTPGARIPRWRSRLRYSWLRQINDTKVSSVADVTSVLAELNQVGTKSCRLVFSHPEIKHGLTNTGIPQCNIDQLNPRRMFEAFDIPDIQHDGDLEKKFDGEVFNFVTVAMKLTRGKLMEKEDEWPEWQQSEYKQLDQYYEQGMFGEPVKASDSGAIFNLVWTYVIKELDKRKKARCTCDGSTRSGQVRVLDHTYANCVDQTGSRLFYAVSAAENKVIFGADVSNAFAEAPAPKQGFFIRPDRAFRDWWENHRHQPEIPKGFVIPVLSAMQGHPESPRLWEKHADAILRELGLKPTVHEPCLYSGIINGERVLFMRQVDDFAVATDTKETANILFDMIDDKLTFPLKRMGLVTMFNGMDILQTRDYIKISVETYLERIGTKHIALGMNVKDMPARPTPLPSNDSFMKSFLSIKGNKDEKVQAELAKKYQFAYRSGIGELIYAMITCRPDISYATVAAAQNSACPADIHYHGVKHLLKYAYVTRSDGIYFWRSEPNEALKYVEPPKFNSNVHDLLTDGRPKHDPLVAHAYMDATWASDPKTRRSFGGMCVRLAGGSIAYKAWLQATVALSSTESEFISASDCGKVVLYIRSILYDLGVPQDAATIAYEDNDACTAMANAQKPTSRTRHIDTRYHALCEWVERDLIKLERVDTSRNMSDHFTKQLSSILFHRHVDYLLGKIPPHYSDCYKNITELLTHVKPRTAKKKDIVTPANITPPTSAPPNTTTAATVNKVYTTLHSTWLNIIGSY